MKLKVLCSVFYLPYSISQTFVEISDRSKHYAKHYSKITFGGPFANFPNVMFLNGRPNFGV